MSAAFKKVFSTEIVDLFPEYEEYLKAVKKNPRKLRESEESENIDPVKSLLQPHLLSCPVCHVYLCGIHGVYETLDSEDEGDVKSDPAEKDYADMNMTYEAMIHRQKQNLAHSEPEPDSIYKGKPCGSDCFLINRNYSPETTRWNIGDTSYFKALFLGMQNEPRVACILAPLMGRRCYDVKNFTASLDVNMETGIESEFRKDETLDWYDNKRKKIRIDLDWGKKTKTHFHDQSEQRTGCAHSGVSCFDAADDCHCQNEGVLCDKFCACPEDCGCLTTLKRPCA